LYDGEALKCIDYDLDVKVYPDGAKNILDEDEFKLHGDLMRYGDEVKGIVEDSLKELLAMIETQQSPFVRDEIEDYFEAYLKLQRKPMSPESDPKNES
jgi:protein associated with RNAse G/E